MTWYIYRGEDLKRDQKIRFPFFRTINEFHCKKDLLISDKLVYSENKVAPTYPGPDVKMSCELRSDLSRVDKNFFMRRIGTDGKVYLDVVYDLVLSTDAANMKFSLQIAGKDIGSVEATYT